MIIIVNSFLVVRRRIYGLFDGLGKKVENREGFSKTEKGNMLLSHPTRLGFKMTCKLL